jgi:transposase
MQMIVIGVDVHKQSVTAVAADEVGRLVAERTVASGSDELLEWAAALDAERLWALEDCRRLTRWLERQLLAAGEQLVPSAAEADGAGATSWPDTRQV